MKYKVQVWIDEIEIEAFDAEGACEQAMELIHNGEIEISPDYAEAHRC